MRSPRNTSKSAPAENLLNAMAFGASGAIEVQEKQGQEQLVTSDVLPTEGIESVREMIELNGGEILGVVDGDPIFTEVRLPGGWEKKSTSHSMWSDLIDASGGKRAGIFYKAAFYDRSAHISANRRFGFTCYEHDVEGEVCCKVTDSMGKVQFATNPEKVTQDTRYATMNAHEAEVRKFLVDNYPDWENESAYWEAQASS